VGSSPTFPKLITPSEFQRESFRIDEQIWDALSLRSGETALFLGLANGGAWLGRAVEVGVRVWAVGSDDATIAQITKLGATPLRGSATMIPAEENAFDVAVAFHYLHEIDPGFHAQVVSELARVGKRVAIVEPSPPADPLGRRIAALYSRAKREAGQFEQYQPIDYWRKLLSIVKADVYQSLFTFTRVPPKHAVAETISLILQAMLIEEMPQRYLDELRALAERPDAQLLPLSRIILVGTTAGEPLPSGTPTQFRPDLVLAPAPQPAASSARTAPLIPAPVPAVPAVHDQPVVQPFHDFGFGLDAEPEIPPLLAAVSPAPALPASSAPPVPEPAPQAQPPFGTPFAVPGEDGFGIAEAPSSGFGWSWEPPEEDETPA
jgi:hypothetical protein